jgi:hypothetical protein
MQQFYALLISTGLRLCLLNVLKSGEIVFDRGKVPLPLLHQCCQLRHQIILKFYFPTGLLEVPVGTLRNCPAAGWCIDGSVQPCFPDQSRGIGGSLPIGHF